MEGNIKEKNAIKVKFQKKKTYFFKNMLLFIVISNKFAKHWKMARMKEAHRNLRVDVITQSNDGIHNYLTLNNTNYYNYLLIIIKIILFETMVLKY